MDADDEDDEAPFTGNDPLPPYRRIADTLRAEIADGRFPVGHRIPSQAQLEDRFGVSRPTVQRALRELRKEGWIDNRRGRAAEVLDRGRFADGRTTAFSEEPERALESLTTHVAAAFEEPEVTIDVYTLTTETLAGALAAPVQSVMRGELNPSSIRVRLLLPALDVTLALPLLVSDPEDPRPLRRLRQLARGHTIALRSMFTRLSDVRPDITNVIEFKTVPVTPMQKLYVLNTRTALSGYYRVIRRQVTFGDGQQEEIFDVLGVNTMLFAHRLDPDRPHSRDTQFVAELQAWFDALWTNIAEPMTLFE
ncbi:GntR family transcriptional regulator [Streptomyces polygonati]|uniref:GntR family transcriptional regulator n=1 Tax=Streptomyces polygonati TaxID=1617087 RepID=A0ABV8HDQ5_9ACTN